MTSQCQIGVKKTESMVCESGNATSFYKYTNKKMKLKSIIPPLQTEDQGLITDNDCKAETLNNYFQSVYILDDGKPLHLPQRVTPEKMFHTPYISVQKVSDIIKNMPTKTSKTPEEIPAIVVKKCCGSISKFLSLFFNLSINTAQIPWQWKFSIITPVHKKGSKNLANNYRPIALTSVICRILEKIISLDIIEHLNLHNLISKNQHGFLPRRSSSTQLLEALNDWLNSCNNKQSVNVVYTDLSKAFDKVSHPKLMEVIKSYGICGNTYNWLQTYLTNRLQSVVLKEYISESLPVTSGVPQGSVIGPLLFLMYIDDISKVCSEKSIVSLFADDAKIHSSDAADLQESLDHMSHFFRSRQVDLAHEECKLLVVGKPDEHVSFNFEGTSIMHTNSIKDLGIWISHDLKWKTHVNKISSNAYLRANHILRSFCSSNVWTLMKAYKTYVRPMLEYGTEIWSPYLIEDKTRIERVQRYFTRKTCRRCKIPYSSYRDRLYKLNIQSLEYRRIESDLLFLYKIIHNLIDVSTTNFFSFHKHTHNTRSHNKQILPILPQNTLSQKYFFSNRCAPIWNSLPSKIVTSPTYTTFHRKLKRFDLCAVANLIF